MVITILSQYPYQNSCACMWVFKWTWYKYMHSCRRKPWDEILSLKENGQKMNVKRGENIFLLVLKDPKNQLLCLNWGSASIRGRIWRPITSLRHAKAVPIRRLLQMQSTHAAFFSLFLEDARLLSFMASHIPRFSVLPEKEERKRENGDIAWHRSSLSQAWMAEIVT